MLFWERPLSFCYSSFPGRSIVRGEAYDYLDCLSKNNLRFPAGFGIFARIKNSLAVSSNSMRGAMSLSPTLSDPTYSKVSRLPGRLIVSVVGFFLIATAILKTLWPADVARLEAAYALPSSLTALGVQIELAVGLWLLSGWRLTVARSATISLFVVFAIFSLYRALAGHESCGCFGQFTVNPWWTFILDVTVVICLTIVPQNVLQAIPRSSPMRAAAFVGGYVVMVAITLSPFFWPQRSAADAPGVSVKSGLMILDPGKWIGKQFPIGEFLSPRVNLEYGEWTVLIYHHDCPQCQAALPSYYALAELSAANGGNRRILLIETPPYANKMRDAVTAAVHVRLADEQEWFVQTPIEIQIQDGQVSAVSKALTALVH